MADLQITDKRRHNADGEPNQTDSEAVTEVVTDADVTQFLAEAPKVYDDPRPLNDRVLIKQHVAETVFAGTTFVIPEVAQKHPNAGVVVAIGPQVDAELDCAPNDLVIFNVYSAEEVTLDGERFIHVSKHDIHLRQRVTYAVASH